MKNFECLKISLFDLDKYPILKDYQDLKKQLPRTDGPLFRLMTDRPIIIFNYWTCTWTKDQTKAAEWIICNPSVNSEVSLIVIEPEIKKFKDLV